MRCSIGRRCRRDAKARVAGRAKRSPTDSGGGAHGLQRRGEMSEEIDIDVRDGVQLIRWRRAHKRNALIGAMYNTMSEALAASEANDAIAAHLFIGSDGVF